MKGYLLNFYKHSPLRDNMLEDESMRNKFNNEFVRNVVWSTFDRLEVREINEFASFRQPGESEKKWVGERQFSMIYEPGTDHRLVYINDPEANKCRFAFNAVGTDLKSMEKYRFFGISILDFTTLAYNEFFSKKDSMTYARKKILKILDELQYKNNICPNSICYDVYGSLGGNDAVIIWLANQFSDIMLLIEALRASNITNTKKGLLSNIYTILGIRDIDNKSINYNDVNGEFHVRLTKRTGYSLEKFKTELCKITNIDITNLVHTIAGEYDLTISIPGNIMISSLYAANGLIHMGKPEYYTNFIQSNTEVCVHDDFSKIITTEVDIDVGLESFTEPNESDIYNLVNAICESQMLKQTPYLGDTLWILYSDYLKNITSTLSYPWTQDLYYQFYSCLKCLESVTEEYEKNKTFNEDKYNYIEVIIKNLRQIILHIAQANRIFFEVPNTHLKNTGTYSKILRAYQGITKKLIKQAYLIPKNNKQTEIIPFINFDSIPIPISNSYKINENDSLLVEIELPYEALVDINRYTYLLAHEIFHYIAPSDRRTRNEILNIISISTLAELLIEEYVISLVRDKKSTICYKDVFFKSLKKSIAKYVLHYVINHFEEFCSLIDKHDIEKCRNDYISNINETIRSIASNEDFCKKIYEIMVDYSYVSFINNIANNKQENVLNENLQQDINVAKQIVKHFHNLRVNNDFNSFYKWIANYSVVFIYESIKNIEKALTEAMPDYYMIQVTSMNPSAYYNEILRIRKILYPEDNNIGLELRISLLYNYCFLEKNQRIGFSDQDQWEKNLCEFISKLDLNDTDASYLWNCISGQYTFISHYNAVLTKYFSLLCFDDYMNDNNFSNEFQEIKNRLHAFENGSFESNISYIEYFQLQESLESLKNYISTEKSIVDGSWKSSEINDEELYASNDTSPIAEDFNSLIIFLNQEAKKIMDDNQEEEIWYRGHEHDTYKLIPSLYRMNGGNFYNSSLRDVMNTLYKAFKVMSYSVPEIFTGGNDTIIGTMASMQHYSLPTNILDWTPSVLNAMYFATESTILKNNDSASKDDGEIWLLNPARLNECGNIMCNITTNAYPIPYMIGDDEESLKPFLPLQKQIESSEKCIQMPKAVYVPFVNQRIKAQNGTFTMFSLDVDEEVKNGKKDFSMYDLYEWQKKVEKEIPPGDFKPFLKKVRISNDAKIDISEHLTLMGIQKHTIYPELENIASDFKKQMHRYLTNQDSKS